MTEENCLISIIIPFYNGCRFVSTCVESLKRQSYSNFEAVFIDDGSTDGTAACIAGYQDERFVVLHQEKTGVSAARNLGLHHATGKYLAFMDIDDEIEPDFLLSQLWAAEANHADMVLCDYKKIYPDGREEAFVLPWKNRMLTEREISRDLISWSIWRKDGSIMGAVWRCLIRRSFWERNKVFFNLEVSISEDLLFLLILYNRANRIYINSECMYRYYMHQDSAVNSFRPESLKRNLLFHQIFVATLKEEGLYEANISQYQSNKASMYTSELSNFARSPQLLKSRSGVKELREELLQEPFDWRNCDISVGRKVSLWMLEHRMYSLLLILYRIKEWRRLRKK